MPDDAVDFAPAIDFEETQKQLGQASERMANFWMGAMSPMWVPFWAATSMGISAWSVSQALSSTRLTGAEGAKPLDFFKVWMPDSSVVGEVLAETENAIRGSQRAAMKMMLEAEEVALEAIDRLPEVDFKPAFVPDTEEVAEVLDSATLPPSVVAAAMDTAADSLEPLEKPVKKKRAPKSADKSEEE